MRFGSSIEWLLVAMVALLWLPLSGCATTYRAEAIEGWVVDAENGKPLEGVIIVAHWEIKHRVSGIPIEQVQIFETVTDRNGRYSFPAWGPKLIASTGYMGGNSPRILLFKPGYRYKGHSNVYSETEGTDKFFWNKKTLKLERLTGEPEEYAKLLDRLNRDLWAIGHAHGAPCGWELFPRMLVAMDAQDTEFRKQGIDYGSIVSRLKSNVAHLKSAGCRSIDEVIRK